MVCGLLSEWCVVTPFYRSFANRVPFYTSSICANYNFSQADFAPEKCRVRY